jgi:hypothetical protein
MKKGVKYLKIVLRKYEKLKLFCLYKFNLPIAQSIDINMTTIFEKQLLIDSIHKLPEDILEVIKENVFHDRDVLYKKKKDITMNVIKNAYSTYSYNGDENEHWEFFAENETINNHIFNSYNCRICGNYCLLQDTQNAYRSLPFSEKIWCRCNNIDEYDNDAFPYFEEMNDEDPTYYEIDEYDKHERMVDLYRDEHTYSDDDGDFDDYGIFNSYRTR